jgi:hypothetical protein
MKRRTLFLTILVMVLLLLLAASLSSAQEIDTADSRPLAVASAIGTSFTYQGQLVYNSAPVNDTCDFTFSLWDEAGSGDPPTGGNQINSEVPLSSRPRISSFTCHCEWAQPRSNPLVCRLEVALAYRPRKDTNGKLFLDNHLMMSPLVMACSPCHWISVPTHSAAMPAGCRSKWDAASSPIRSARGKH